MIKKKRGIYLGIILLPFKMIWALIGIVFNLTGMFIAAVIGIVLMILGIILTVTVIGAVIGIPFICFGFLLIIRALF